MVIVFALFVGVFLMGFGLGRVKNARKLAAVRFELSKVGASVSAEVSKLAAAIKAKL
jgi:hypothetical protein